MNIIPEQQLPPRPRSRVNSRKKSKRSSKKVIPTFSRPDIGKDIEAPFETGIDEADFEEFSMSEASHLRNLNRQESITILKVTHGLARELAVNSNFGRMNNRRDPLACHSQIDFKG